MISSTRAWAYEKGIFQSVKLPAFVVSVGNISLGGTGKSPFVMELAEWAVGAGLRVAVLSRGYKRSSSELRIVRPGEKLPAVEELGDEPWMIKSRVPGISLLVHADRVRMAKKHWQDLGNPQLVILDDGFQHWRAYRDLDVVMVDAEESLDQGTIPFGRLRERVSALQRADLIVLSRADSLKEEERLRQKIAKVLKRQRRRSWQSPRTHEIPIVSCRYQLDSFVDMNTGEVSEKNDNGSDFFLLAGVAKPLGLKKTLGSAVTIKKEMYFSDHHAFQEQDLGEIDAAYRSLKKPALLMTEKDWARWHLSLAAYKGYFFRVRFEWLRDSADKIEKFFSEVKACSISR